MSDEDRIRSEIARMQMRGDELTDQVHVLQFINFIYNLLMSINEYFRFFVGFVLSFLRD